MRNAVFLAILLRLSFAPFAVAQTDIRHVDFKNFSYPWSPHPGWPHQLEWLNLSEQNHIQLVNGRWRLESEDALPDSPFSGLTLESVQFDDASGSGRPNAIVVLRLDTGGTQYSHYVYIYTFTGGSPKLLSYFHSGDRSCLGLYRVYGGSGKLIIELYDPEKKEGDCCSSGFIRTRYRWHDGRFEPSGIPEYGTPKTPSRLAVTAFGTHQ